MAQNNRYSIERKYIRKGNARSGQKIAKVLFLVAHETANPSANADAHFKYFDGQQPSASAHTFIDDGKILEIVPIDEKAWHVQYAKIIDNQMFGDDANDAAIGVEICRTGNFAKAYDRYVWYFAYLCKHFGLNPKKHIVAHSTLDPQRRSDPESWLSPNGVTWTKFINDVTNYYNDWDVKAAALVSSNAKVTRKTKAGDTLWGLSKEYGVTLGELERLNPEIKATALPVGITLKLQAAPVATKKYTSIVDYLNDKGMKSDLSSRKKLAESKGIKGYTGTAAQNTKLLQILQG